MLSHAVLAADKMKIRELINSTVILAAENNPSFSFWVLAPRNETGDRTRQRPNLLNWNRGGVLS